MFSIHETKKSLDFLMNSSGELSKSISAHSLTLVPKVDFEKCYDPPKDKSKKNHVSEEIYKKIVDKIFEFFESSGDSFITLPSVVKMIYNKGIRPKITPEEFVDLVLEAIEEVRKKIKIESLPDVEGVKYRRISNV